MKTNKYPLYLLITEGKKNTQKSIGIDLSLEEWDEKKEKVRSKHPNSSKLNILLAKVLSEVEEVKIESIPVVAAQPKQEITVTNTSGGFTNTKESGLAEVIPGSEASKKYLVLHRNAPIGSVIRVKNEENDLTIFARVVGVLPETGDNTKVLIKLSQAAYEQLKGIRH